MRTFPIFREDGSLRAFEISNARIRQGTIARILRTTQEVTTVHSVRRSDTRLTFRLAGHECEVWEPFGDSSRLWIGPVDASVRIAELSALHDAFAKYRSFAARLFRRT